MIVHVLFRPLTFSFRDYLSIVQYIAGSILKETISEVHTMLRRLVPNESLLIRLINQREWEQVKLRLKECKEEAAPTHSASRGVSPTALVLSLRNKAKIDVIQALVDANIDQLIQVKHHRNGTALHEAIRNDVTIDIVIFLLKKVVKYERSLKWKARGELMPMTIDCGNSGNGHASRSPNALNNFPVDSSSNTYHVHSTLLNQSDGMGRSPLHYLIERYVTTQSVRDRKEDIELLIQKLVKAFPPSVGKRDSDGLTPLDIALIGKRGNEAVIDLEYEMKIYRLCSILLEAYPSALMPQLVVARASLKLPSHLACCKHDKEPTIPRIIRHNRLGYSEFTVISSGDMPNEGNIENNPLSYAILHGRHSATIELLLNNSAQIGSSWHTGCIDRLEESDAAAHGSLCCMTLVSRDLEVPLHIATTMNAPLDILSNIVTSNPLACVVEDRCGLMPFDWLWIRHLLQERSYREDSYVRPIRLSRRRIISEELSEESKIQSERLIDFIIARARNHHVAVSQQQILNSQELQLLEKSNILLPAAAETLSKYKSGDNMHNSSKSSISWSAIHAAAYLECPPFLLLLTVISSPRLLMVKDSFGNLPLHYLAARSDYKKNIPLGVTSTPREFREAIPIEIIVSLNPRMLQIYNEEGRLPIHIAIDRHVSKRNERCGKYKAQILCKSDPETLEKIDGKTGLVPFALSAVGPSSDLDLIYNLLRECPSLL